MRGTDSAFLPAVPMLCEAAIVISFRLRGRFGIESIAAFLTNQQAGQQIVILLIIAWGKAFVFFQPLVDPLEKIFADNCRDRDGNPFLRWAISCARLHILWISFGIARSIRAEALAGLGLTIC